MNYRLNESGNVLFLILTVVFLFGALTYAATSSSRFTGGQDSERETSRISGAELAQYAGFIENAIARVMTFNDCSEDMISFEHTPFDGSDTDYVNPSSPTDFSCHIFHPNGGGVSDRLFGAERFDFSGSRYIVDIGTTTTDPQDRADLYAMLAVGKRVCEDVNERFDVTNPEAFPPVLDGHGEDDLFTGTFDGTNPVNQSDSRTYGAHSFCGENAAGIFRYIHVLLAR